MSSAEMEAFVRECAPRLLRRARLLTPDQHLAEDLTQEALTRVVVAWRRVARADDPDAYAQRILVNTFMSCARGRSFREVPVEVDADRAGAVVPGTDAEVVDLARALSNLTPEARAVVVLRYHDDLSVAEVAAILGRTPAWVRQTAHRATERLRDSPDLAGHALRPHPSPSASLA